MILFLNPPNLIWSMSNLFLYMTMKLSNEQIYEIVKIVVTAILSIAATVFVTQSCTTSLTIQKHNEYSSQSVDHSVESSVDSTHVNVSDFAK